MTFADIFAPLPPPPTSETGRADSADNPSPTFNVVGKVYSEERREKDHIRIRAKAGLRLSALSAPPLVPLEAPWVDGGRFREAGATEARTRLDLYLADPNGPWIRRHGVLIACEGESHPASGAVGGPDANRARYAVNPDALA